MNLNFASIWESIADLIPNQNAMICGEDQKTWSEYEDLASRLATSLSS
jgi:3-oxocholest-4-en-26-oate---CoA ligase